MIDPYEQLLAPYACKASQSKGRLHTEDPSPTRNPFQRDRDRIIHAVAFRRLMNKTQVFVVHEGDHFRTRLTHTLEVAQIARNLARSLKVQEDLAECVALAHDLGHPPFGHGGEDMIDECLRDYGGFDHNDQSMRVVTKLEKCYAAFEGLNLSWEVLEGLAKHNGPVTKSPAPPTIAELDQKFDLRLKTWASLEAQIGNLSDDIAYNNHDIDDGLRAGLFTVTDLFDLPVIGLIAQEVKQKFGKSERSIIANEIVRRVISIMGMDVLNETKVRLEALKPKNADDIRMADRPMVAFSEQMTQNVATIRKFLHRNVYGSPQVQRVRQKTSHVVRELVEVFMHNPNLLPPGWQVRIPDPSPQARARIVADYVSGMTDRFAIQEHARLFNVYAIEGLPSV
jgi:dGTPase